MRAIIPNQTHKGLADYVTASGEMWQIQNHSSGVCIKILDRIIHFIKEAIRQYSRLTVVLSQLHLRHFTDNNRPVSTLIKRLKLQLKKIYQCKVGVIWVREHNLHSPLPSGYDHAQHYHIAVVVSGHKAKSFQRITQVIKQLWGALPQGGHVYPVKNCVYHVRRDSAYELKAVVCRLSYFAKHATKEAMYSHTRRFSVSKMT